MANWLSTREAVKRALGASGLGEHGTIDLHVAAASKELAVDLNRDFIPVTATRYFDGPGTTSLWLPMARTGDLVSITSIKVDDDGDGVYELTLVANTDYWLWPDNITPKNRIDLNPEGVQLSAFPSGRRRVEIVGLWSYSNDTKAAGAVASGLAASAAATTFVCSDGSLIDVGDTLLIASEQVFVSERSTVDTTANLGVDLTADMAVRSVTVNTGTLIKAGETILIDAERIYVESISANVLTVIRAHDGSTLAAHTGALDVYAFRTLTIVRGVNGTTAVVHADAVAISKYVVPEDIERQARADAIYGIKADQSGQTGIVGAGDSAQRVNMRPLGAQRDAVVNRYRVPAI